MDHVPTIAAGHDSALAFGLEARDALAKDPSAPCLRSFKRVLSDPGVTVHTRVRIGPVELPVLDVATRFLQAVARSIRDGYAVRAAELPGSFRAVGEVRAGGSFAGELGPGECVEVMTGAPLPSGADCVVGVGLVDQTARCAHCTVGEFPVGDVACPNNHTRK